MKFHKFTFVVCNMVCWLVVGKIVINWTPAGRIGRQGAPRCSGVCWVGQGLRSASRMQVS